jgi:hypothetical protein
MTIVGAGEQRAVIASLIMNELDPGASYVLPILYGPRVRHPSRLLPRPRWMSTRVANQSLAFKRKTGAPDLSVAGLVITFGRARPKPKPLLSRMGDQQSEADRDKKSPDERGFEVKEERPNGL